MRPVRTTIILIVLLSLHCVVAGTNEPIRWLFNPTPRSEMGPMTTDRFGMTLSPLTIDPGHVQLETDVLNYSTLNRTFVVPNGFASSHYDSTLHTFYWSSKIRVGLTERIEAQAAFSYLYYKVAQDWERRGDPMFNYSGHSTWNGNYPFLETALKVRLVEDEDSRFAAAIIPFIFLPLEYIEHRISLSGGVNLPVAVRLPHHWEVRVMPGFLCLDPLTYWTAPSPQIPPWYDSLYNWWRYDYRRPTDPIFYVNSSMDISKRVTEKLTLFTGFITSMNINDPDSWAGAVGVGGAYQLFRDVQLDFGNRFGVTETSMDYNPFLGISVRF